MIRFAAPHSLDDCTRRLEASQTTGVSLMPYYRVTFLSSTQTTVAFRFELWIGTLRLGYAQGGLTRDTDTSTNVQGIAIVNNLLQFIVVAVIALGILYSWQHFAGNSNSFLPFAIAFIVVGQGIPIVLRGRITAALQRALA